MYAHNDLQNYAFSSKFPTISDLFYKKRYKSVTNNAFAPLFRSYN